MSNDMFGGIFIGIGLAFSLVGIFQIGINVGIKTVLGILEHEYPAAFRFVIKNKEAAKVIPYVMVNKGNVE